MYSKTTIANLALAYLGQAPISSLQQDNEHDWAFATVEKPLVPLPTDTAQGQFVYVYPADALFIRRIYGLQDPHTPVPFEERFDVSSHARVLVTAVESAGVRYTRRMADETQYDPAFVKCFALALACDAALALTGDIDLSARLQQKYTLYLEEARRNNMSEGAFVSAQKDAFSEVR